MLYFHQEGCPYCKATIEKNFSDPTTKEFIQENFDVVEINIRGSRSITLPDGDVVDDVAQRARRRDVQAVELGLHRHGGRVATVAVPPAPALV